MTELSAQLAPVRRLWRRIDPAWGLLGLLMVLAAMLVPAALTGLIGTALGSFANTLPFILFAILAVAYVKASGAERLLARAFEGSPARMVVLAALLGGLSPFCSCEVIPFIAALLALGAPLSAVMAFWLSSPLMDPAMFAITAGGLGFDFAIAKTVAAVGLGLLGGFAVMALSPAGLFADPLKPREQGGCGCGVRKPFSGAPVWRFWGVAERRSVFAEEAVSNGHFLIKWLALAYFIEALMIAYLPADLVASALGGSGLQPILLGAVIGGPAYLNGYAAVPMLAGLLEQGMSPGAALSFMLAGGVSCIPAAIAVWALVRARVFAAYIALGFIGSVIAGLVWGLVA
ncbi:MAG: permease [Alphaproteobacteria bacterium]|nr:MAG: permease [Alphaproteobacteria bacterium]